MDRILVDFRYALRALQRRGSFTLPHGFTFWVAGEPGVKLRDS